MGQDRYLQIVGKRWWVVALIAFAAGLSSSLVYLGLRPRNYVATVSVVVPVAPTSSVIPATSQAVADLQAMIASEALAARVAAVLGLDPGAVREGLGTSRLGSGGVVEVRFESTDRGLAKRGVVEAARQGLAMLAQARLAPYEERLQLAEEAYQAATADVQAYLERFGSILPQTEFDRIEGILGELRARADAARAEGDLARAGEIEARIASLAGRWSQLVVEWQTLSAARSRAQRQLESAQLDEVAARSALEAALNGDGAVLSAPARPVPRVRVFLDSVVPIVVLATILAIGLVIGVEFTSARRERTAGIARASSELHARVPEG